MTRLLAWEVLRRGGTAPLRHVGRVAREHGLDPRDRALLRRIVATEVRRRGTLQALVRHFGRGRPSPDLAAFLRIGLVQIFFLDAIPDHAAVSETVRATADALGLPKGRYVNAVLRAAIAARREGRAGDPRRDLVGRELHLAEPVFHDPDEHLLLWAEDALSLPAQLLKRWVKRMGREAAFRLAEGLLDEPRLSLRAVTGERDALAAELEGCGVETSAGAHPALLVAPASATEALLASAAFREGRATVQGETAVRAAELGAPAPGERWLDLCAAPGGKTALLAGAGASVLASDRDEEKLALVRDTVERLRVAERVETRVLDPEATPDGGPFDGVLADVPCSNTGVLAQRPEARWRFGPQSLRSLAELQERLLATAARALRPGGRLVYSTCSIEPDENERRVRALLDAHPELALEEELHALPAPRSPNGPVDGGYAARLRRREG